jgi:hypothetical protein
MPAPMIGPGPRARQLAGTNSRIAWWHYDYEDGARYPVLDIPFSALGRAR